MPVRRSAAAPASPVPRDPAADPLDALRFELAAVRERLDDGCGVVDLLRETADERFQLQAEELNALRRRVRTLEARFAAGDGSGRSVVERLDEQERALLQIIPRLAHVERAVVGDEE